jgi:hypothetical protein
VRLTLLANQSVPVGVVSRHPGIEHVHDLPPRARAPLDAFCLLLVHKSSLVEVRGQGGYSTVEIPAALRQSGLALPLTADG